MTDGATLYSRAVWKCRAMYGGGFIFHPRVWVCLRFIADCFIYAMSVRIADQRS